MTEKGTHTSDCDWHVDQYPWECTCGVIPRKAGMDELIAADADLAIGNAQPDNRERIARLIAAGDRLVVFVRHNARCATSRGRDYCNCDHDTVVNAWKEERATLRGKRQ